MPKRIVFGVFTCFSKHSWSNVKSFHAIGKLTLVARIGMEISCVIHGIGIVFAYILHIWLYIHGYLSTVVFFLMLLPAPIGLRQVRISQWGNSIAVLLQTVCDRNVRNTQSANMTVMFITYCLYIDTKRLHSPLEIRQSILEQSA